jgi:hypothetical protein
MLTKPRAVLRRKSERPSPVAHHQLRPEVPVTCKFACIALILGGLLLSHKVGAATSESKEIDLSERVVVRSASTKAGTFTITLRSILPNAKYSIESEITQAIVLPAPLTIPQTTKAAVPGTDRAAAPTPNCDAVTKQLYVNLNGATDESRVAELVDAYPGNLREADDCPDETIEKLAEKARLETSFTTPASFSVSDGEDLHITVARLQSTGIPEKKFGTFAFITKHPPGTWIALYGVNYIRAGDERYFADADASASPPTYTITPFNDRQESQFSPSIYFMWIKQKNYGSVANFLSWNSRDVFGGVTAGLGFDFDSPTAFLGYGVGWGYNVMLTAGVAMHKEKRLNGKYSAGDVISENLSEDQLTEDTYKPRAFVGIAFRFGSNPFKTEQPKLESQPAAQ